MHTTKCSCPNKVCESDQSFYHRPSKLPSIVSSGIISLCPFNSPNMFEILLCCSTKSALLFTAPAAHAPNVYQQVDSKKLSEERSLGFDDWELIPRLLKCPVCDKSTLLSLETLTRKQSNCGHCYLRRYRVDQDGGKLTM